MVVDELHGIRHLRTTNEQARNRGEGKQGSSVDEFRKKTPRMLMWKVKCGG